MTVKASERALMIRPEDIPPSREGMKVIGTFNPGATRLPDGRILIVVRVSETVSELREGYYPSPYYDAEGEIQVDWIDAAQVNATDPRVLQFHETGFKRLGFVTHLRLVYSVDGMTISELGPILEAEGEDECWGIEDPRVTNIDGDYYMTYVGVSSHGVVTKLFSSEDGVNWDREGIIFTRENKDVVLFPEEINGQFMAMHRPTGSFQVGPAEMWLASSPDMKYWGDHRVLWSGGSEWDGLRTGGGVPPIRTERGWLCLYHGRAHSKPGEPVGAYTGGAILLDLKNPNRVIGHTPEPFMVPELDFETTGFVNNIVFPTGAVLEDEGASILVYYGAADQYVGVARYTMTALLDAVLTI